MRFFASGFFHESVSPQPQSIPLRPFRIFSKIRGDIRNSRCTTGINDTGCKIAAGTNDTGDKFATGVVDRWCTLTCEYLREFSKKFEMILLLLSGAWGKVIHEKNLKQKISWHCPFKGTVLRDRFLKCWKKLTDLGLNKCRGWFFLNFRRYLWFFVKIKHLLSVKC